jgi:NADPH:quinone reductase-like Zn-dependent oxidoreductase
MVHNPREPQVVSKSGGVADHDGHDGSARHGISAFILVSVTTAGLELLAALVEAGKLRAHVGEVLPLAEARQAHEMLAGRPHRPGKIVLVPAAGTRQC